MGLRFQYSACPTNVQVLPGAPCNVDEVWLESVAKLHSIVFLPISRLKSIGFCYLVQYDMTFVAYNSLSATIKKVKHRLNFQFTKDMPYFTCMN